MKDRKDKVCFCCPVCGRYIGKIATSDSESECTCSKCGTAFVLIVKGGRVITFTDKRNTNRSAVACAY